MNSILLRHIFNYECFEKEIFNQKYKCICSETSSLYNISFHILFDVLFLFYPSSKELFVVRRWREIHTDEKRIILFIVKGLS